jgi:WD40 repeat protein
MAKAAPIGSLLRPVRWILALFATASCAISRTPPNPDHDGTRSSTLFDGFDAEVRGDLDTALAAYTDAGRRGSARSVPLAMGARVSAQLQDRPAARRMFEAAELAYQAEAGRSVTTATVMSLFHGGTTFEWLGRSRVAVASRIGVSVLGVDEGRVEYLFQVPGPALPPISPENVDDTALTRPTPLVAFIDNGAHGVRVWNYLERRQILSAPGVNGSFVELALAPGGTVVWGHDDAFSIWAPSGLFSALQGLHAARPAPEPGNLREVQSLSPSAPATRAECCALTSKPIASPDGARIAAGSECGQLCVWDSASGSLQAHLDLQDIGSIRSVCWSRDGGLLAGADNDGRVVAIDGLGNVKTRFRRAEPVRALAFSPDGTALATVEDRSMTTSVMELAPQRERWISVGHGSNPGAAAEWSPDGSALAVQWTGSGGVVLRRANDGTLTSGAMQFQSEPKRVQFLLGGGLVVESSSETRFWGTASRAIARRPATAETPTGENPRNRWHSKTTPVAFSPDGSRSAIGSDDGVLEIFDSATGSLLVDRTLLSTPDAIYGIVSVQFLGPARLLVVTGDAGNVLICDSRSGEVLTRVRTGRGDWANIVADQNGQRLAASGAAGGVAVWDVPRWKRLFRLPEARKPLRFSTDGSRLVVSEAGGGSLVSVSTGAVVRRLDHLLPDRSSEVAISKEGDVLAAGTCAGEKEGDVRAVCAWDASSGEERLRVAYDSSYDTPVSVALSADARWLAVAQPRGADVQLWDLVSKSQAASLGGLGDPHRDGAYVRATDGRVDFVGPDAPKVETLIMCSLGDVAVSFAACRERFLTSGLLPLLFAGSVTPAGPASSISGSAPPPRTTLRRRSP